MDNIWFYVISFLDLDEIVIMSYVSNNLFTITRQFEKLGRKPCDLIFQTINKGYFNITKFLINKQYNISTKSINLVISLGNFELLNKMNYNHMLNNDMIISAIKSNNIKMVNFIKNKLKDRYVYNDDILQNIMKIDNISMYKLLIGGSLSLDRLVTLIDHNCINIIEFYRFGNGRNSFEIIVNRHANFTHNQIMINHCIENNYAGYQTTFPKLSDYL